MAEPFLGELRLMSFNFPPKGWARCDGQLLPINQNQALFALLGSTYGGDARVNFALPDLRNRVPIHAGGGFQLGARIGAATHTLTQSEMPTHVHTASAATSNAAAILPTGGLPAAAANVYGPSAELTTLAPGTVTNVGGSQAHENRQPYLNLAWCIALQGIFPSQN